MRMCLLLEFHSCYKSDSDSFNAGYNKRIAGNKKHTMVQPLVWKEVCHCVFCLCIHFGSLFTRGIRHSRCPAQVLILVLMEDTLGELISAR